MQSATITTQSIAMTGYALTDIALLVLQPKSGDQQRIVAGQFRSDHRSLVMKKVLLTAIAALVTSAAFAQAAGGTATKEEISGQKSKSEQGVADKAQAKVEARKEMNTAAAANAGGSKMMVMDTNGDGMISRREYDAYHKAMWTSMKQSKGMVSQADMDAMRKGGPN
jgi:hypothetical protein